MVDVLIRQNEACAPDPFLLWDTSTADGLNFDWALAHNEPLNVGGLAASHALGTAVALCLFTDKRVDPAHPLAWLADGDPRGWWGDGVDVRTDLGETELGSLLWLFARAPLTAQMATWAQRLAADALAPLKAQGAVVRIDCSAVVNQAFDGIALTVQLFGRDGQLMFDRKFDLIWKQVAN